MPKQIQKDDKMKTVSIRMPPALRSTAQKYGFNLSKLTRAALIYQIKLTQMKRSQSSDVYAAHPGFYDFINKLQLNGFLPCGNLTTHNVLNDKPANEIIVTVNYISKGSLLIYTLHKFEEPCLDTKEDLKK